MRWKPPNNRPHGPSSNRECANCVYPCTGGEVLHRRGHCCRTFCPCLGFEPMTRAVLTDVLNRNVSGRRKRTKRFLDQGKVEA